MSVVTDGFTGNIALKTAEGTAKLVGIYLRQSLKRTLLSRVGSRGGSRRADHPCAASSIPAPVGRRHFPGAERRGGEMRMAAPTPLASPAPSTWPSTWPRPTSIRASPPTAMPCAPDAERGGARHDPVAESSVAAAACRSMSSPMTIWPSGSIRRMPGSASAPASRQRYIAVDGEKTSDLALGAARAALIDAGIDAGELDMIICATTTPDESFPATATVVQAAAGHDARRRL